MAATSSSAFPLATSDPYTGGSDNTAGTANAGSDGSPDNDAGASGSSSNNFQVSQGALIAIILIVVFVALLGSKALPSLIFIACANPAQSLLEHSSISQRRENGRSARPFAGRPRRSSQHSHHDAPSFRSL